MGFKNQVIKIIFLAFFSFLGSVIHGQGNLQFNQVIRVVEVLQTVPTGKVWKIESTSLTTPQSWGQYLDQVNDNNIAFIGNFHFSNKYPHTTWLPAGSYNLKFYFTTSQNGVIRMFSISGIEFNLVP